MKITTGAIFFFITACIAIAYTVRRFREESMSLRSALLWIAMWTVMGLGSVFPSTMDHLMRLVQMGNRIFFILLFAVFVMLILIFNLTSKLERVERRNMVLTQELTCLRHILENRLEKEGGDAGGEDGEAPP